MNVFKLILLQFILLSSYHTIRVLPIKDAQNFSADQFENLYVLKNDVITKYDISNKEQASFSNPLFGDITAIDVSNALTPIIFFGDTYRVGILDNRLNESASLNLIELGFNDPKLISVSDDQHLWIYDQSIDKLIRYHFENAERTNTSLNISQLLGMENTPTQMVSTFENVFLNVPEKGILVFDATGAFQELIPIPGIRKFHVAGNQIYFIKDEILKSFDRQTKHQKEIQKNYRNILSFMVLNNKVFQLHAYGIEVNKL